jgi:hypothetical protein
MSPRACVFATVPLVTEHRATARKGDARAPYALEHVAANLFDALCYLVVESRKPGSDTNLCSHSIITCVTALAVLVGPDEAERDYELALVHACSCE